MDNFKFFLAVLSEQNDYFSISARLLKTVPEDFMVFPVIKALSILRDIGSVSSITLKVRPKIP